MGCSSSNSTTDLCLNAFLAGADFGDVQLYGERTTGTLKIVADRGVDQEFLNYFKTVDASDTAASGLALRPGVRIVIKDVNTHPGYEPHGALSL